MKEFRECYLKPGKPVIITGLSDQWPAYKNWNPEYLAKLAGDRLLNVSQMDSGDYVSSKNFKMTLKDYLNKLDSNHETRLKFYLAELPILKYLPELLDDLILPDYFNKTESDPNCFLYVGKGVFSQLHFHTMGSAMLTPLYGYKKIRLFAPDQTRYLYKYPWYSANNNMSKTTELDPDIKIFPEFEKAKYIDLTLNRGEVLFIPIYWWHGVTNEAMNIAVVTFWGEKLFRRMPPFTLILDYLFGILKDSPNITRGVWQKLKSLV